jgi:hypothetical protein
LERLPKKKRTAFDEDDAEPERDQKLVLVRTVIEVADDDTLRHHANDHDEDRSGDHGDNERTRVAVGDPARVAAEHEHRAVREIEDAERPVDDGQPRRDQCEQGAEHQAVEALRQEIRPIDHRSNNPDIQL